jgi:hypothetical protein
MRLLAKTHVRFVLILSLLSLVISGCSLFQRHDEKSKPKVRVVEVPAQIRADADDSLKHRIIVLPFLDENVSRSSQVAEASRRALIAELNRLGRFVIINNDDLPKRPSEFINEDKEYNIESMAKIVAPMGVSAIVEGKVYDIRAKRIGDQVGVFRKIRAQITSSVRLRVASARNGRLILEELKTGVVEADTTKVAEYSFSDRFLEDDPMLVQLSVQRAFESSIPNLVKSVEKLSWEGRVAMVNGERLFINAGRMTGIQIGDILKVTDDGNEVFDPESGEFIGKAPGRLKGTLEVISYFGKDGAIGIVHSGSGFKENDRVELY